jgi:hypothetical protein
VGYNKLRLHVERFPPRVSPQPSPKLQYSNTPSLRSAEIEDGDDDENENEVHGETRLTV